MESTVDRLRREIQLLDGMDILRCNRCQVYCWGSLMWCFAIVIQLRCTFIGSLYGFQMNLFKAVRFPVHGVSVEAKSFVFCRRS